LRRIEDTRKRNRALLDWVERRRREFGGGLYLDSGEEPTSGWGSLEEDVFQWVFESRIATDSWSAVKLYAELNRGAVFQMRAPAAAAILEASSPSYRDDLKPLHTTRALAALTAAYKDEPPGAVRDWLARAVGVIGGPKRWEEVTGNAHGVVALLEDPDCRKE